MKWILPLLTICTLASCSTKPYMVGSVNDMFYKRYRTPGERWRIVDYSWQERLFNTAHIPVMARPAEKKMRVYETQETYVAPVTYSK